MPNNTTPSAARGGGRQPHETESCNTSTPHHETTEPPQDMVVQIDSPGTHRISQKEVDGKIVWRIEKIR